MRLSKPELLDCENLLKLIKRSKFTLTGDEILALARAYHWLSHSFIESKKEIETQSKPVAPPVTEEPKKAQDKTKPPRK
jgi:hypothetical protein